LAAPSATRSTFNKKIAVKLPALIAAYALKAGLNPEDAMDFVTAYATYGPVEAAKIPGVTLAILDAAQTGSQWAYAQSLHYVWYVYP